MNFFLQMAFAGLSQGAIYALIAYGFNVTYWTVRVVNFAHGSFLMFCVMLSLAAVSAGVPLAVAVPSGIAATALLALALERVAVRPVLHHGSGMGWVVSTLGAGIVLQASASLIWGAQALAFPPVIFQPTDYVPLLGVHLSLQLLLIVVVAVAVMAVLETLRRRTLWGKALRAAAADPEAARLRGIPVQRYVTVSFLISGALAGLAGILIAPISGIEPSFGLNLMIKGFVAAVVGGLGSSVGALAGGLMVGLIELFVGGYVSTAWRNGVVFALLVCVLMARPQGLLGRTLAVKY